MIDLESEQYRDMLEMIVIAGERFRRTPIVDDDFIYKRDTFDRLIEQGRAMLDRKIVKAAS